MPPTAGIAKLVTEPGVSVPSLVPASHSSPVPARVASLETAARGAAEMIARGPRATGADAPGNATKTPMTEVGDES